MQDLDYSNLMEIEQSGDPFLEIGASEDKESEGDETPEVKTRKKKTKQKGRIKTAHTKKLGNQSLFSKRQMERETKRNLKAVNEKIRNQSLLETLGNPWDNVTMDEKKHFAIYFYYKDREVRNYSKNYLLLQSSFLLLYVKGALYSGGNMADS